MGQSMAKDAINVLQKIVIFVIMLLFLNAYHAQKDLLKVFQKQKLNAFAHCPLLRTQTINVNAPSVLAGILQNKIVKDVLLLIVNNVAGIIQNAHFVENLLSCLLKENVFVLLAKDSMLIKDVLLAQSRIVFPANPITLINVLLA